VPSLILSPTPTSVGRGNNMRVSTLDRSDGVGRTFDSVCLSVCLSVCPEHNSKTNDPKVFKLYIAQGMILGYPTSGLVLRLKVIGQG